MVAAEAAPYVKVGGLADVIGALPKVLASRGHDVRIAIPAYGLLGRTVPPPWESIGVLKHALFQQLGTRVEVCRLRLDDNLGLYVIQTDRWFSDALHSEDVYTGDPAAYVAFGRACADLAGGADPEWLPDVVHSHDWHAGLTPVYVVLERHSTRPALVHTIHNMAYAGVFPAEVMDVTGLPRELFTWDRLEFYGGFSFLKAAMVYADMVNTVSKTYAREVTTPEIGGGLAGLAAHLTRENRFRGITNGLDTECFNPATDATLPARYSADDLAGKRLCKEVLQRDVGLEPDPKAPVFGMVARICEQKGQDIVASAADAFVRRGMQLVVLGVGDPRMASDLRMAEARYPGRMAVRIGFDAYLANRIYAGSDAFLVPSRYEPCGLGQLIAMRYGSVPVVRRTGGLADTVRDVEEHPRNGNGFVFDSPTPDGLLEAMERTVVAFRHPNRWKRIVVRGMREDHSWANVAPRYEELYAEAMYRRSGQERMA